MAKLTPWTRIKAEYLGGAAPRALAEKYDITAKSIHEKASKSNWAKEKAEISKNVQEIAQERITSLAMLALDTLEGLLRAKTTENNIKVQSSKAILDLSGLKTSKIEQVTSEPIRVEFVK